MGDTLVMEAEYGSERSTGRKRKPDTAVDGSNDGRRAAAMRKITLALTKPSFVLGIGPKMLRAENRTTLRNVLRKLMMQQNWVEASGVLSMLLKGTLRDRSPIRNRLKYSVIYSRLFVDIYINSIDLHTISLTMYISNGKGGEGIIIYHICKIYFRALLHSRTTGRTDPVEFVVLAPFVIVRTDQAFLLMETGMSLM